MRLTNEKVLGSAYLSSAGILVLQLNDRFAQVGSLAPTMGPSIWLNTFDLDTPPVTTSQPTMQDALTAASLWLTEGKVPQ